jgi:hypothetical protein
MPKNQTLTLVAVTILCAGLTGCSPSVRVTPLGGGYEEVTYTRTHISEPESHQITLQFRNAEGKQVMIWPPILSDVVVKEGVAVLVASKTITLSKQDSNWPQGTQLFAVKVPELPLDITDEVLGRWAQESGIDVAKALYDPAPMEPKEQDGKLNIPFEFTDRPETAISLSWDQLLNIMNTVKTNGVQHKDPQWNMSYIEKEFKPETTDK